ncbi:MAG TPA: AraC family transcriptional regulator [Flavobacteriales bacterium]|nr:AraC family transcriptional regulator [Flavobacteriales bacterium]HIO67975.1 AraC family transcriptional regulator [Flavobacteriales bacterium]
MDIKNVIPLHNFSVDNDTSGAFKLISLESRTGYDTSVPHRHNYYEIFLFEKGGGTHEIDFNLIAIEDRSIHFVSPGQVHKVNRELDSRGHLILFSRDFFYSNSINQNSLFDIPFLNNNFPEPVINLTGSDYDEILSLILSMKGEYANEQEYQRDVIQSYLNLLIINCKRLFDKQVGDIGIYNKALQDFKRLLENEFDKNHQVSYYANQVHVSVKQLSAITKKAVGKTALELIHDRIILEAKRLLRYSDHSIKEISFFLNFDDPSHFGKFFKSKQNQTPKEYRTGAES